MWALRQMGALAQRQFQHAAPVGLEQLLVTALADSTAA